MAFAEARRGLPKIAGRLGNVSAQSQEFAQIVFDWFRHAGLYTNASIAAAGGPSTTTLSNFRKALKGELDLAEPRGDTLARIDDVAGLPPGSARIVWEHSGTDLDGSKFMKWRRDRQAEIVGRMPDRHSFPSDLTTEGLTLDWLLRQVPDEFREEAARAAASALEPWLTGLSSPLSTEDWLRTQVSAFLHSGRDDSRPTVTAGRGLDGQEGGGA